jgi:hypothetical protein
MAAVGGMIRPAERFASATIAASTNPVLVLSAATLVLARQIWRDNSCR